MVLRFIRYAVVRIHTTKGSCGLCDSRHEIIKTMNASFQVYFSPHLLS